MAARWGNRGASGSPLGGLSVTCRILPVTPLDHHRSLARNYGSPSSVRSASARGPVLADEKRFVPDFQLVVDGTAADPELKGAVLGIRVTDDMDKASRFWVHLSDVDRKWTKQNKFKPGAAIEI